MITSQSTLDADLKMINESVYLKCGFTISNVKINPEGVVYAAYTFEINGYKIEHRASKITPTKTGQFVTIWKRNKDGITTPFDISDDIDFVFITSKDAEKLGQFIFPKSVLAREGIFSQNGIGGRRGIRVYPPWDIVTSKQAEKTQRWQTEHFVNLRDDTTKDLNLVRELFGGSNLNSVSGQT